MTPLHYMHPHMQAVQELGRRGLVCDMGIKFWNLPSTIALIKQVHIDATPHFEVRVAASNDWCCVVVQCPKVTFVIDHIAKPDIKSYWDCVRAGNASVDKSGTADKVSQPSWSFNRHRSVRIAIRLLPRQCNCGDLACVHRTGMVDRYSIWTHGRITCSSWRYVISRCHTRART